MLTGCGHSSHRPGTSHDEAKDAAQSLPSEAPQGVYAAVRNC